MIENRPLARNVRRGLFATAATHQNGGMSETLWWPALVLALHQNRHAPFSRFVQMATVRADGRPANRTIVFRGFLNDTHRLTFVTDQRSTKVTELEHAPRVRNLPVFPGHPRAVPNQRPDDSGAGIHPGFRPSRRPGAIRGAASPSRSASASRGPSPRRHRDGVAAFPSAHPDPETPLSHFCLLILDPHEVDLLEINGRPQNRWVYHRSEHGRWNGAEVNP